MTHTPASTPLGWAYVPVFPGALVLSDSVFINSILADIPFFITGLLGFAVLTFFLIVRQVNRYVCIATFAVASEFVAAILDLSQLLQRGEGAIQAGIDASPPIIIIREVALSLAPGFLFLFFWFYVALPPRGELQAPYNDQPYSRVLGILSYPDAYHCGRWYRWGFLGIFLQWILLAVVIAVPALQMAWRISSFDEPFGIIYNASVTTEILLSSLLILKINGNVWLSNLGERWRIFRDYTPILSCLVIGLGLRVGNVEVFKFSDSPLGRFLQALESYGLFLYILCATFYPSSTSDTQSATASFIADPEGGSVRKIEARYQTNIRTSEEKIPSFQSPDQPMDRDFRMPHPFSSVYAQNENPSGSSYPFPIDRKSVTISVSAPKTEIPAAFPPPSISDDLIESRDRSPAVVVSPDGGTPFQGRSYQPSPAESSPVYGLNGIVRASAVPSSINSRVSDLSSLYRRQAELDKSVEGLLRFSRSTYHTDTKSPAFSDFSLSNFPVPPTPVITRDSTASQLVDPARNELVMGNATFSLIPPRMPAAGHGRQASVPLSTRGSEDGLMTNTGGDRFPSDATRYDVTSFIGGYAVSGNSFGSLRPIYTQRGKDGSVSTLQIPRPTIFRDTGGPDPAPLSTGDKVTSDEDPSQLPQSSRDSPVRRGQDRPFVSAPTANPNRVNLPSKQQQQKLEKLDISRPLQRFSVEDALAYERPREPPAVNDSSGT